jgi:hypothetical protein
MKVSAVKGMRSLGGVRKHLHFFSHFSFNWINFGIEDVHKHLSESEFHGNQGSETSIMGINKCIFVLSTVTLVPIYNAIILCDTSPIASDILWYQLIPDC